ncbi:acetyl-CoA carboxylase, partial [Angomonas deanei]
MCRRVLEENNDSLLHHGGMKTVYFIVHGMVDGPHIFTFRKSIDYQEDTLIRNVLPQNARRLELDRLSNFDVAMYPTPFKEVHVFKGTPKKQGASHLENRLFARVSVTANDMGMSPWTEATDVDAGHMLAKCVAALEVARDDIKLKYPPSNHVFIKMIDLTFDLADLKRLLLAAASSYQQRLLSLGVNEVEIAFQVRIPEGVIPMRVIVDSPSGFGISAHVFYESVQDGETYLHRAENSEDVAASTRGMSSESLVDLASPTLKGTLQRRTYSKLEALRDMLPSKGDNISFMGENASSETLSGATLLGPYPQLNKAQVKRLQAKAANTTYAEDWPALLQLIVKKDWSTMRRLKQVQGKEGPKQFLKHTQLYITEDGERLTNQKTEKTPLSGMLVWLIEYSPPSYFDVESRTAASRQIVLVANDITFQSGSFAVPEDVVFKAASDLAREKRIPFVYISANSGARIGLIDDVKRKFLVSFTPKNEIDYLYVLENDYKELVQKGIQMDVTEKNLDGTKRYIINGIIGGPKDYIGVENLSGSGLVAGHMSQNYSVIPTISVVSGRSVGIGAYLNRLGRRVIQTNDSPLILTGASALNRLLGKEVYSDNSQLGGKQVMVPNGVTHWCTKHDYGSARALLRWLDYVPPVVHPTRCSPRRLTLTVTDPIDRDVTFLPEVNAPYDPRFLVTGVMDRSGLFDRGSWTETLEGWA